MRGTRFWIVVFVVVAAAGRARPLQADAHQATAANATPAAVQPDAPPHPAVAEPRAIPIPGTDLELIIGGYVKVDFIQDFDAIGDRFEFKTNSIYVGDEAAAPSGQTTIHARETRLNLDLRSRSEQRQFRAFVEGDFFGDGNAFRLRHAYGEFGGILGGQSWSTFQDISARPLTVDFEGADGEVFVRQAMIRLRQRIGPLTMAAAVEHPTPQFAVPSGTAGAPRSVMPDIPFYIRYESGRGHVQAAAIVRQLRFDSTGTAADAAETGWGVNTTATARTFGRDQAQAQFVYGLGVARYIESLSGQNLDAVLTPSLSIKTLRAHGFTLGYTHHWHPTLKSGVSVSGASVERVDLLSASSLASTRDARANLFWTPYRAVDVAGELLWGRRENQDDQHGTAWRFQFAFIFRIN